MAYIDGFVMAVPTANSDNSSTHANSSIDVHGVRRDPRGGVLGRRRPRRQGHRLPPRRPGQGRMKAWCSRGSNGPTRPRATPAWRRCMKDPRMDPRTESDALRRQAHDLRRLFADRGNGQRGLIAPHAIGMRSAFACSHCANVCRRGLRRRVASTSRGARKSAFEIALVLEHVAQVVGAGKSERRGTAPASPRRSAPRAQRLAPAPPPSRAPREVLAGDADGLADELVAPP